MLNKTVLFLFFTVLLFKITAVYFTQFSLYGDEAQYWLWSQSLDLGYFSKPPLLAWFLSGYINIFDDSFFSLKMFPIVVFFLISIAIYNLCLSLSLTKKSSVLCAISFLIIPAASLSSFLISTDLLLLLFWTIAMTKLLEIRFDGSILNFFLLGLFLGLSFLAKYAAIYFFLNLLFLIIIDQRTLSAFKKNPKGVFVFIMSFFLVILPNLYWNVNNDWITLSHTSDNANLENLNLNFYEPINFLSSQILMLGPILCLAFIFLIKYFYFDFENKFLLIFSLPIIFIVLIESFLVRANANWAAPALISIFILFYRLVYNKKIIFIKINFLVNYLIVIFLFNSILISSENKVFDRIRGIGVFVKEVSLISKGKDLVVSDRVLFSNISYELKDKTTKIYMPYKKGSPITNHFQMNSSLKKNHKNSFFLIGEVDAISYLSRDHESVLIREFHVPFNSTKVRVYEVNFK